MDKNNKKYRVCWYAYPQRPEIARAYSDEWQNYPINKGEPIDLNVAEAWANQMQGKHPHLTHWVEEC